MKRSFGLFAVLLVGLLLASSPVHAGSYGFADANSPFDIDYPPGYTGSNNFFTTTICVNPAHPDLAVIDTAMENIARTFTDKVVTTGNVVLGAANNVPSGEIDFESVALHELGHCLGLGHTNLGSAVANPNREFTYSYQVNGAYNFDDGVDNIDGSSDDDRDDDQSLVWFFKGVNNPFTISSPVDTSTFSRVLSDLPVGHNFVASGSRDVGAALGFPNTEAVMKQLTFTDEAQRTLVADDVAALQFAQSGIDETAGTSDDFTYAVSYVGVGTQGPGCDIEFQSSTSTGFARCSFSATTSDGVHWRHTSGTAQFNPNTTWFYNQVSNAPTIPVLPNAIAIGLLSILLIATVGVAVRQGA